MVKNYLKMKYYIHVFLQKYNEALVDDALSSSLKSKLKSIANHHEQKAMILRSKLN
ncbi:hypothetical protein [Peribacillus loiseleuriae]|uniref:hypothetical protein n=1 Tax=Peribacillus loiseleuriae TaxID=1679170 RepID=UPI000AB706D2|nr:hypothetical protein [Peribacillus loiseleuriae]